MTGARVRVAALIMAMVSALAPGTAGATAAIEGAVRDTTGLALPGVTVLAQPAGGGEIWTAVTGANGRFAMSGLAPGPYDVTFTLPGFRTVVREGVLAVDGAVVTLAVEMLVQLEDRVVVVGSRARPRSVTESAVPVNAIPYEDFVAQGDTDVGDQLRALVPSYNVSPSRSAMGRGSSAPRPCGVSPPTTRWCS